MKVSRRTTMPVNMPLVVAVKARAVEAQATRHVLIRLGDGSMKHRKVQRPTVVAGDFNDNVLWDNPKKLNNHGINVGALTAFGLRSAYHQSRGVDQGQEPEPTIYWRNRKIDSPRYHIDYCFVPDYWIDEGLSVDVGHFQEWVGVRLSDHVPLVVDVNPHFPGA